MIRLFILVLLSISACHCRITTPAEDPKPPHAAIDAGTDASICEKAEANLTSLGCITGAVLVGPDNEAGTADDKTFAQVCESLEEDIPGSVNPGCLVKIDACKEMDGCAVTNE